MLKDPIGKYIPTAQNSKLTLNYYFDLSGGVHGGV